jgi:geranylgeranyl diphosphate synthase type I
MSTPHTRPSRPAPESIARVKALVDPALRASLEALEDDRMRRIATYQMGWCDAEGTPTPGGGKAIRPTLAVLSSEVVGGRSQDGVPAAVAVELVHNFSLLHDDVMDGDVERRHRPTGWVVFGTGPAGQRCLPCLLTATQRMIGGQSQDLDLEGRAQVDLDEVLRMEAGKTAALLSCAASIGAIAAGAPIEVVDGLAAFGREAGIAFQLVDDILGVAGDPDITGKSSSSDVRAGKRSAPIVAALRGRSDASRRLATLLAGGPPATEEDVTLATELIHEAGGVVWASNEADARFASALDHLHGLSLPNHVAIADLTAMADYIVNRGR